ncbi:hypothetical protein ACJ73_09415, partial [Blastomyces percursus]
IQPRPLTPPELLQQRTSTSIRALRGLVKQINRRHRRLSIDIKKVIRAGENIALDRDGEVLLIENKNLQTALNNERKRRKRGKRMGLCNPSNPSLAQFFSPSKVQAAREQANAHETAKINELARKEDMKLQRAIFREQKQAELMKQKEQRKKERLEAARRREEAKAASTAKRLIEKQQRDERKLQLQKEKEERAAKCHEAQLAKQALAQASKRSTRRATAGSKRDGGSIQPSKSSSKCHPQPTPVESNDIPSLTSATPRSDPTIPKLQVSRSGRIIRPSNRSLN